MPPKTASNKKTPAKAKPRTTRKRKPPKGQPQAVEIPRATSIVNEDDVLLSGGSNIGFGRCGGRVLSSRIEKFVCDKLSAAGVAHSHSPRHFEVRIADDQVAAYAPMIVLRGRGREGKTMVIEAAESAKDPTLAKVQAFRKQYGVEFYIYFVATEEVLDEVSFGLYDESVTDTEIHTLVNRLAE